MVPRVTRVYGKSVTWVKMMKSSELGVGYHKNAVSRRHYVLALVNVGLADILKIQNEKIWIVIEQLFRLIEVFWRVN